MKKMIAILMVMMMFGLVACGNQDETDGGKVANNGSADDEFDWMKGECVIDSFLGLPSNYHRPCGLDHRN